MSKGGIKKKNREPSQRSRAARREASPSLDAGRAVRALSPAAPQKIDNRPSVLAIHHGAGVSKKAKTGRKAVKTNKQRRRHERGLDRAEAVADITAKKIERSLQQEQLVRSRKKTWDDVNKGLVAGSTANKKTKFGFELLGEDDGETVGSQTVASSNPFAQIPGEVNMDGVENGVEIINEVAAPAPVPAPVPAPAPAPAVAQDDDDEII